ncbi:hypothetical protein AV929_11855 [Haloarcula sp. K1]|nr:hypothetical protein AV929_11855 [Haloarcula sp. K1]
MDVCLRLVEYTHSISVSGTSLSIKYHHNGLYRRQQSSGHKIQSFFLSELVIRSFLQSNSGW